LIDRSGVRVVLAATLIPEDNLSLQRVLGVLSSKQATVELLLFQTLDLYQTVHLQVRLPATRSAHVLAELEQLVCVVELVQVPAMLTGFDASVVAGKGELP
jgi:hypothetical protein